MGGATVVVTKSVGIRGFNVQTNVKIIKKGHRLVALNY